MNKKREIAHKRLGRYPFEAGISWFVERRTPYCTSTTIAEDARKLHYFAKVLERLKGAGEVSTTDPRHMGRDEIERFMVWMKGRGLSASTRKKYLAVLDHYLRSWGNTVVGQMRADGSIVTPATSVPIRALTVGELQEILDATYDVPGWRGQAVRGLVALGFGTGARPKEMFGAQIRDVDIRRARFYVRHPKGEGTYGVPQWIPIIRGDMIPYLEEFLQARTALGKPLDTSPYLFPAQDGSRPVAGNTLRAWKHRTEELTGIQWEIKDLRSSLASITVAGDVSKIKAVSLQLRHARVSTTEQYYARIDRDDEIRASLGEVWKSAAIVKRR